MNVIDKLFFTSFLVFMIGFFSIQVTSNNSPDIIKYIEVIITIIGLCCLIVFAFLKIWI